MKDEEKNSIFVTNGGLRNAGLFSYVGQVIGNLHVADLKNIPMWVNIHDSPYLEESRGPNCWDYYFEQPFGITKDELKGKNVIAMEWFEDRIELCTPILTNESIKRARELTKKYIKPLPFIKDKIEKFKKEVIKTSHYGAIHFRGTDHFYNNLPGYAHPIISKNIYFRYIEQLLKNFEKVLVCSDQQDFVSDSIELFGNKIVSYPSIRSNNNLAIHYNNNGVKYQTGEDVIVESYLMSYSNLLIRTCSGVTHFSIFNSNQEKFKFINIDDIYYGVDNDK